MHWLSRLAPCSGPAVKPEPGKPGGEHAPSPETLVTIKWSVTQPRTGLCFGGGYACTDGQASSLPGWLVTASTAQPARQRGTAVACGGAAVQLATCSGGQRSG